MTRPLRRDLPVVISAKAVSLLGDEVASVALMLKLQASGASPAAVAALLIAAMAPLLLLAPLVGRMVDRFDSRTLLLTSGLAQSALCLVLAFQSSTGAILALVFALGVGEAFNGTIWQSLIPAIAGQDGLAKALSRSQAATTVAMIAGSPIAGLLSGHFGSRAPLLIDAVTYLGVAGAALLVGTRHGARTGGAPHPTSGTGGAPHPTSATGGPMTRGGIGIIRRDPMLRLLIGMLGIFVLLGSMVNVVIVFLVRDTLHGSDSEFGVVLGSLGVGMIVGALGAGRLSGERHFAVGFVVASVVLAGSLAAVATAGTVGLLLPITFAVGMANGVLNVTLSSLTMGRVDKSVRGRVAASVSAVSSAGQISAYLVGGGLAAALSPRQIFLLAGSLGLLAPLLFGHRLIRSAGRSTVSADGADGADRADRADGADRAAGTVSEARGSASETAPGRGASRR